MFSAFYFDLRVAAMLKPYNSLPIKDWLSWFSEDKL